MVLLNNWEVSMLGARTLESTVLAMLKRDAMVEDENGHGRALNEQDVQVLNELRIVEDVCLKLCYVTTLNRARQWALNNGSFLFFDILS